MFGDGNPGGSFGVYHLWLTQTNVTRWANLGDLSNEGNDCTFVNNTRVIYNMQGRFAGSPYHQEFDTPNGNLCHYKWEFNDDDNFWARRISTRFISRATVRAMTPASSANKLPTPSCARWACRGCTNAYVAVYVNGNRRGALMEDTQVPDSDMVKEHFPNDTGGFLYKMQPWFEFAPFPERQLRLVQHEQSWCHSHAYTTTGGVKKPARYRYNFEIRRTPDSDNDFTNVFSLVDAANSSGTPNYVANMENMANMENWMRVFAANHAAGNLGFLWRAKRPKPLRLHRHAGHQILAVDVGFQHCVWQQRRPGGRDRICSRSTGRIPTWRTSTATRPSCACIGGRCRNWSTGRSTSPTAGRLLDAKYNAFVDNGLSVENPNANIDALDCRRRKPASPRNWPRSTPPASRSTQP